jgi:hypothetical protein
MLVSKVRTGIWAFGQPHIDSFFLLPELKFPFFCGGDFWLLRVLFFPPVVTLGVVTLQNTIGFGFFFLPLHHIKQSTLAASTRGDLAHRAAQ